MTHLDDAALDAIEQRADNASRAVTEGPWEWVEERKFVDHALADIPALLAAVREARAAATALEALGRERNTWARQLADLRDERDAANTRADDEWRKRCEIENDRRTVHAEDAEQALVRVRELFSGGPDTPCRTTWPNGIECVEVPMEDLRRALDSGQQEATPPDDFECCASGSCGVCRR